MEVLTRWVRIQRGFVIPEKGGHPVSGLLNVLHVERRANNTRGADDVDCQRRLLLLNKRPDCLFRSSLAGRVRDHGAGRLVGRGSPGGFQGGLVPRVSVDERFPPTQRNDGSHDGAGIDNFLDQGLLGGGGEDRCCASNALRNDGVGVWVEVEGTGNVDNGLNTLDGLVKGAIGCEVGDGDEFEAAALCIRLEGILDKPRCLVYVANSGPDSVTALQKLVDDMTRDETCGSGHEHPCAIRDSCCGWRHGDGDLGRNGRK